MDKHITALTLRKWVNNVAAVKSNVRRRYQFRFWLWMTAGTVNTTSYHKIQVKHRPSRYMVTSLWYVLCGLSSDPVTSLLDLLPLCQGQWQRQRLRWRRRNNGCFSSDIVSTSKATRRKKNVPVNKNNSTLTLANNFVSFFNELLWLYQEILEYFGDIVQVGNIQNALLNTGRGKKIRAAR